MKTVMVTRLATPPPALFQGLVDEVEDLPRLGFEVAGEAAALVVGERGLAGEPHDPPTLGDDAR
jgi:hypothetical protein